MTRVAGHVTVAGDLRVSVFKLNGFGVRVRVGVTGSSCWNRDTPAFERGLPMQPEFNGASESP
jgi:hypothetical protein